MPQESLLITMSREDLKEMILTTLEAHDEQKRKRIDPFATVSINQAAKLLNISHTYAKKLINQGKLKTTADEKRVLLESVTQYLNT